MTGLEPVPGNGVGVQISLEVPNKKEKRMDKKCKLCGKIGSHYCEEKNRTVTEEDDGDLFDLLMLGTAIVGMLDVFDTGSSIDIGDSFGGGGGDFGGGGSSGEW
jgi:hypothetical protein